MCLRTHAWLLESRTGNACFKEDARARTFWSIHECVLSICRCMFAGEFATFTRNRGDWGTCVNEIRSYKRSRAFTLDSLSIIDSWFIVCMGRRNRLWPTWDSLLTYMWSFHNYQRDERKQRSSNNKLLIMVEDVPCHGASHHVRAKYSRASL